ncbi:GPO family capsid scaffolding protein [Acidovorax sp. SUPP1855]|uniref:GPO family capsid scaffolding protein n=1 Tax=Acidovorax sp. SUPP1855 TaxID=431774 RepID=UPI0023DE535B|nr:GPO family capsid scaffolding protein [Acidovorax sp. SUPP1855]GKS83202.1 GPO family capsid scaffolding protein [Acidovorax sp. SUPP1855]
MADKTAPKSKFFRVATEGATTDGRTIDRACIDQMATNFDPKKYGARVWLEHYRGVMPDSPFKAYGDVLAVEARDVEDGKRALFAQIAPLPELVAMNKAKQKIYTSVEIHPKFGDSGQAYLTGLAVTDSPASLGTDVLTFAQQKPSASPFTGRKSDPSALFSEAVEVALEFEDAPEASGLGALFADGMKAISEKFKARGKGDDARFAQVLEGFQQFSDLAEDLAERHDALQASHDALAKNFGALDAKHAALLKTLEGTPAGNHTQRPAAAGGNGRVLTDC